MIDVKRLRELAQAALWTGNWYNDGCNILMCTYPENSGDLSGESDEIRLVEYMAAAQPKAILALCDRLEAAEKDAEKIKQAAHEVLNWTEAKHRPPKAEVVPTGEMALVRVHALVELHAALAQRQGEGS
ncbi:hypothetical protein [Burkholderia multivorans]|uniref:hypothetical protein n=1 Tax=Burkholderia multivorans TaxID=87883 RepID=UPI002097A6AB|nr:hypothetical protein [Burkholderia multivorans]MCO7336049.1 hypothetical protein [Burkholderia multivorans]HDR9337676.1 hypothetical protein [Burkholderia multivorans]